MKKKYIKVVVLLILAFFANKELLAANDVESVNIVNEESSSVVEDNNTLVNEDTNNIENTVKEELTGVTVDGKKLDNGDSITVENDITTVSVYGQGTALYYISVNGKSVSGNSVKLEEGSNAIVVKDENGKTITVYVTRKKEEKQDKTNELKNNIVEETVQDKSTSIEENKDDLYLTSIKVDGFDLSPSFKSDIYSYTINIDSEKNDIKKLDIIAISNKSSASITVDGADNLVEGENIINIILKSSDEKDIKTYQITVNKKSSALNIGSLNKRTIIMITAIAIIAIIVVIIIINIIKKKKDKKSRKLKKNKGRHS